MSEKQKIILDAVEGKIEVIETERYNSKDPIITLDPKDSTDDIIIKLLTSERTGAPLQYGKELLNPAEDLAKKNFRSGVRNVNSWQFKRSTEYLDEAARVANDHVLQQRINLFKQLNNLLQKVLQTTPERVQKRTRNIFDDILSSLGKYDKLSTDEQQYYKQAIDSLYTVVNQLNDNVTEILTQQLLARCSISLTNKEYLAAYIWLYKMYLLNKEVLDKIAADDKILEKALTNLKLYLESETGLKPAIEDLPVMASAFDLQTIFIDHLTAIYDIDFMTETKQNFRFKEFK
ncbi:MAG: hypothetical protein ACTSQB_00510 [Candidatus Heimdallarchaeota archaeon]